MSFFSSQDKYTEQQKQQTIRATRLYLTIIGPFPAITRILHGQDVAFEVVELPAGPNADSNVSNWAFANANMIVATKPPHVSSFDAHITDKDIDYVTKRIPLSTLHTIPQIVFIIPGTLLPEPVNPRSYYGSQLFRLQTHAMDVLKHTWKHHNPISETDGKLANAMEQRLYCMFYPSPILQGSLCALYYQIAFEMIKSLRLYFDPQTPVDQLVSSPCPPASASTFASTQESKHQHTLPLASSSTQEIKHQHTSTLASINVAQPAIVNQEVLAVSSKIKQSAPRSKTQKKQSSLSKFFAKTKK